VRDNKEVNKFIASQTALGRVGLPDDIGGTVASVVDMTFRFRNQEGRGRSAKIMLEPVFGFSQFVSKLGKACSDSRN
jgi:hypothetical protein